MTENKIYTNSEEWWKDRKKVLEEDLKNAESRVSDPEIVKLMRELLNQTRVVNQMKDYFEEQNGDA